MMKRNAQADLEICRKATPGPWKLELRDGDAYIDAPGVKGVLYADWYDCPRLMCKEEDLTLILTAREGLEHWINKAVRLEAENARLRKVVEAAEQAFSDIVAEADKLDFNDPSVAYIWRTANEAAANCELDEEAKDE